MNLRIPAKQINSKFGVKMKKELLAGLAITALSLLMITTTVSAAEIYDKNGRLIGELQGLPESRNKTNAQIQAEATAAEATAAMEQNRLRPKYGSSYSDYDRAHDAKVENEKNRVESRIQKMMEYRNRDR